MFFERAEIASSSVSDSVDTVRSRPSRIKQHRDREVPAGGADTWARALENWSYTFFKGMLQYIYIFLYGLRRHIYRSTLILKWYTDTLTEEDEKG